MSDWNAERYHEVSTPQQAWGRKILDHLSLTGGERALDIGCGTGRLTALLAERLSEGRVTGLDRSPTMIGTARSWLQEHAPRTTLVRSDAILLPFTGSSFDLVFSTATFHWIHDHPSLFAAVGRVLKPGGRLVAQCGGGPNVARLHQRSDRLMRDPRFAAAFAAWSEPWNFADVETTASRLADAGLIDIDVNLEEAPARFDGPEKFCDFISTVCVRPYLTYLAEADRPAFLAALTNEAATDDPAFTLDYWRLNISARRPV
jgi:trans-aconitate 2-methyltransferase